MCAWAGWWLMALARDRRRIVVGTASFSLSLLFFCVGLVTKLSAELGRYQPESAEGEEQSMIAEPSHAFVGVIMKG